MSGSIEAGTCSVCKKEDLPLRRKYFYYDIKCDCCYSVISGKNVHFEYVAHCKDCEPTEPRAIRPFLLTSELKKMEHEKD